MAIIRIPQRETNDCAICSVAMVLGYPYERVQTDRRQRYGNCDNQTAWWEHYLEDEGRIWQYRPTMVLETLPGYGGDVVGLLVMSQHRLRAAHIVAIDELGFVDPSDGFPDHLPFDRYPLIKSAQGFVFDQDFLAIANAADMSVRKSNS
jgi:hypothetical protein